MDILSDLVTKFIQNFLGVLTDEPGRDFGKRVLDIQQLSNDMICKMLSNALTAMDQDLAPQVQQKKEWTTLRIAPRTLQTVFGCVSYERRYYTHKQTGQNYHLLDSLIGIEAGVRVSDDVRQKAVELALEQSYQSSGRQACPGGISKSIVGRYVSDMKPAHGLQSDGILRKVSNLYVEADEDHVALQDGRNVQMKLVYIHEGVDTTQKRHRLKNPRYLTWPLKGKTDDLWEHVDDYIVSQYDQDSLKKVYLSGDGAKWIAAGQEWLPHCIPIMDGFHVSKRLIRMAGADKGVRKRARKLLYSGKREGFIALCYDLISSLPQDKRKAKSEQVQFFLDHWQEIQNRHLPDAQGCSAEGHVSHILSDRLSSRPLGWGEQNLVNIAQMRVMRANGQIIEYPSTKNVYVPLVLPFASNKKTFSQTKRSLINTAKLPFISLPILTDGKRTSLYQALDSLFHLDIVS